MRVSGYQTSDVMQRYEIKYVLSNEQVDFVKSEIKDYLKMDDYGLTTILSIYFDTPDYKLIRNSIQKPPFKEKIRMRSYRLNQSEEDPCFLEIKRKAKNVVYKRRIILDEDTVLKYFSGEIELHDNSQIAKEIKYIKQYYGTLLPAILIINDRIAYKNDNGSIRLTIDFNLKYRIDNLNLHTSVDGAPLLDDGKAIMEIKVFDALPIWLANILSKGKIYKCSFSKVGEAYKKELMKKLEEKRR